jgi:DNA polymerase-1
MAKAVNFGIVYGMSPWGLAEELHISTFDANNFINRYFAIYPEIKVFLENIVNSVKEVGYTETIFGRRRYIPEIKSSNGALRQFGERTAKNAPIQGAAADVIKFAMVAVDKKFNELGLKSKMIAQVHDELVIDTVIEEVETVKQVLKEVMENVVKLDVLLEASLSWGTNWDMK